MGETFDSLEISTAFELFMDKDYIGLSIDKLTPDVETKIWQMNLDLTNDGLSRYYENKRYFCCEIFANELWEKQPNEFFNLLDFQYNLNTALTEFNVRSIIKAVLNGDLIKNIDELRLPISKSLIYRIQFLSRAIDSVVEEGEKNIR